MRSRSKIRWTRPSSPTPVYSDVWVNQPGSEHSSSATVTQARPARHQQVITNHDCSYISSARPGLTWFDLLHNGRHRRAGIHTTTSTPTTKATPTSVIHYSNQASRSLGGAPPRCDAQATAACRGPRMCRSGIRHLVLPPNDNTESPPRRGPLEGAHRRQRVRCSACICLQVSRRKGSCMCIIANL